STLNGARIGFGRATGRFFAQILSCIFGIGYLIAGFTERRQALHDLMAGTVVVNRSATSEEIAAAPPESGVEWIALLVLVIPLIGILAAIAIPAYQNYTIRAQVMEGLLLVESMKGATTDFYARNGRWPSAVVGGEDTLGYVTVPSGKFLASADFAVPGSITL